MRQGKRLTGLWLSVALAAGCAARQTRTAPPPTRVETLETAAVPARGERLPPASPEALRAIESRQAAQLAALVHLTGQGEAPAPGPVRLRPQEARPSPPSAPAPSAQSAPPNRTRVSDRAPRSRCARICRHVAAICYAARRICTIARTLGEPEADAACHRARDRCTRARDLARRHCSTCPREPAP